jgi:hypothetical protein
VSPAASGTPGVQDGTPLFYSSGWHTYNWANYGPVYAPGFFTTLVIDQLTSTTARVTLTPAYNGTWRVLYGKGRGTQERSVIHTVTAATPDSITLFDLQPGTLYTLIAALSQTAVDQTGQTRTNVGYSDQQTFVTTGGSTTPIAPQISKVAVQVTGSGIRTATITWQTDVPCISKVNYGATVSYGSTRNDTSTPAELSGATVVIGNLTPSQTIHYQCSSQGRDQAHSLVATTVDANFGT